MSDLVPSRQSSPAQGKAGILPDLTPYLDAERELRTLSLSVHSPDIPHEPDVEYSFSRGWALDSSDSYSRRLKECLQQSPPTDLVEQARMALHRFLDAPPRRNVVTAAVALLVDSRTKQPPNPAVFIQAAAFDLFDMGFPPGVVVVALQRLRREHVFGLEVPDLITACSVERDRLREIRDRVEEARRRWAYVDIAQRRIPELRVKAERLPERPGDACRFPAIPPPPKRAQRADPPPRPAEEAAG